MATLNLDFYSGEDIYCDGSVEDELLEYYKGEKKLDLFREDTFYITSPIRENIINWYPFKKDSVALEIGGGMGPITGAICDKCKKVVSVENSKKRATILYERHKMRDNLEVYAANIKDLSLKKQFDYVILIGVFEYSKIFFDTENPFEDFLNYLKELIKPDGKILIAIENRYGIKYFAGVTEDHYSKPFLGLKGYENLKIQTLGMGEWKELLKKCSLSNYKFYYPYPDYKMPSAIFSENYLPKHTETSKLQVFNYAPENYLYDYRSVLNGIIDNKMFDFFSNSYFIEIANDNIKLSDISFSRIQNMRNDNYKTLTIMHDNKKIYKYPLSNKNIELKQLKITHEKLDSLKIDNCKLKLSEDKLEVQYIEGPLLGEYIYTLYLERKKNDVLEIIDKYYKFLEDISIDKKIENPISKNINKIYKNCKVLKIGLPDLNMSNIIINNGKFTLIDQEFGSDKEIPLDYTMYFSINLLYEEIPTLEELIKKEDLLSKYNLTIEKQKCLIKSAIDYFKEIDYFNIQVKNYIEKHSTIDVLYEKYNTLIQENNELSNTNQKLSDEIEKLKAEISESQKLVEKNGMLQNQMNDILNSKSWKITEPFRKLASKVKK